MNRRVLVLALVVAAAVVAVLVVGFALGRIGGDGDSSGDAARVVTVTGTGTVKAVPDVAEVTVGVSSTAKTPRAARSAADAQMARVLAAIKARGVKPADLQTADVSLSPNYGRDGSSVTGYTASDSVTATIRKLDSAGAVVAAATAAGANQTSGPTLSVADEKLVYQRALKAAVADARAHAGAIADAGGETVGDLRSATEGSENSPIPYE